MAENSQDFLLGLQKFGNDLTAKFNLPIKFNPEDQLKGAVEDLIFFAGQMLKLDVKSVTEAQLEDIAGRPDIGVTVKSLTTGHIELKAPGKGADTRKFKGADKQQWNKFQDLPNIVYTDGNQWALYRNGERIGKLIRFCGDITTDGKESVDTNDANTLFVLLRDFFYWEPIVPTSPKALAEMLAPITRYLRSDVLANLHDPDSSLSALAADWRKYLFPDADDNQFADAYAQTLTYALLLAKFEGLDELSLLQASKTLQTGHLLLSATLKILGDDEARKAIDVPINLLERFVTAIDVPVLMKKAKGDLWLYFYEDFLAAYDSKMRKDRGVYFTPVPVVKTQVKLVDELLRTKFDKEYSFTDSNVITLDPAAGTGTYILTALEYALDRISNEKGPGMRASAATMAANNIHAFELLVGAYAVAHLRITQQILQASGKLPDDGVHVYLTDTLESPHEVPPQYPMLYKQLGEEHKRAQKIKASIPVFVCMGNPPYDRQQIESEEENPEKRKGGWVRFGDKGVENSGILQDFLKPLATGGLGLHAKNLYNDYVYFWRWALWKVFESKPGSGIISFITASSYLRGPGFTGMREVMRRTFDELWIIDLEGDNLGARKTENVFAIRTPVAIAIGVRYDSPNLESSTKVYYSKIEGTEEEKLAILSTITNFKDLEWRECPSDWTAPFLPVSEKAYWGWPLITDIFPWQENGMQFKRSWPISESPEVLMQRWKKFLSLPKSQKASALRQTDARRIDKSYPNLTESGKLPPLQDLKQGTKPQPIVRYSYRSFDRQWILMDGRLCDRPRPTLINSFSDNQIFMTSLLTTVLGAGPSAVATSHIPDTNYFCNRGARDVIPLWRDTAGTLPNLTDGVLPLLTKTYGKTINAEDLFAYCYAILATPKYVQIFWDELTIPGSRIPITKNHKKFEEVSSLGRKLIWLHTYGERFVPLGMKPGTVPQGVARCKIGTPAVASDYPNKIAYDEVNQELHVGKGVFDHVRPEVWRFSVSGLEIVESWVSYRLLERKGKTSSPLDDIRPETWQFDNELLDLLWVLDATVDLIPEVTAAFEGVLGSDLFSAQDFPMPNDAERKGPQVGELTLFAHGGIDI
ncbi:type ISP restriction/modification enzyme [Chloroflexota bacterium]